MPSGRVYDNDGMSAGCDVGGDFLEMQVHRVGVAFGEHERGTDAPSRAYGPEYVGRESALITGRRRARSAFRPSTGDLVLLTDPRLVLPPDLYRCSWRQADADRRDKGWKVFLNAS